MSSKVRQRAGELGLVLMSLGCGLVILEIALHARQAWARRQEASRKQAMQVEPSVPLHVLHSDATLYGLNPAHPDISSQGLRNDEVAVPKPAGVWRLLVLGDSVTFGTDLRREQAYPAKLQEILHERFDQPVEVVNAGVPGYTPYNQLEYYRSRGRGLEADVVVVGFCMNDVANPRLHWDYTGSFLPDIPAEAIPNVEYDKRLAQQRDSLWARSAVFAALKRRAVRWFGNDDAGPVVPTFITGEDASLSIHVLVDESSAEWKWLTAKYDALRELVAADGAELVLVIFPLEYQLDPQYPYLPQENLKRYGASRGVRALDVLTAFRADADAGWFLQETDGMRDAWHLSERGHARTAELLADLLLSTATATGDAGTPARAAATNDALRAPTRIDPTTSATR